MSNNEKNEELKRISTQASSFLGDYWGTTGVSSNPWSEDDFDKLDAYDIEKYSDVLKSCRFFYKHDAIANTVIDKMIDIGITKIRVDQGSLSDNEYNIFKGKTLQDIQNFIEEAALEYLISGLVVPEIQFDLLSKKKVERLGVIRRQSLLLPDTLYIRNPETIKIKKGFLQKKPSYFLKIPDKYIFFILNNGIYPDQTEDREAYKNLIRKFPELVKAVKKGKREVKLDNKLIIQGKTLSNSDYPVPFLYPALEPMRHKRNIRRMDYSIAARAIAAILHVTLGSDEFPVTADDEDAFNNIEKQMRQRDTAGKDIERIFQLFTNHTVDMNWVYPELESLLNNDKYEEINEDILYALGFPRILVTGETQRTGTSQPKFAMMSPYESMKKLQRTLLPLVEHIVYKIVEENNLTGEPSDIRFEDINLYDFSEYIQAVIKLYEAGGISKESFGKVLGFNVLEELEKKKEEKDLMEELGLEEFSRMPFSPQPNQVGDENSPDKPENKEESE